MKAISKRAVLALVAMQLGSLSVAQIYHISDLGVLPGDTASSGNWINSAGQVAGCSDSTSGSTVPCSQDINGQHAFLWIREGCDRGLLDLGTLPGGNVSQSYGISDSGEVVGYSYNSQGNSHAFKWTRKTGMSDLGTLTGGAVSSAVAINSEGVIVGNSDYPGSNGRTHAVMWNRYGKIQDLGVLAGALGSSSNGNNDFNQVVGASQFSGNVTHAFFWSSTTGMQDLYTLPGGTFSYAGYINTEGLIVGGSRSGRHPKVLHCVLWDTQHKIHDLGILKGGTFCGFSGLDDLGRGTGVANVANGDSHAVIWTKAKGLQDLNDLIPKNSGWVLHVANSSNRAGQIVGYGTVNGQNHGFLLTP
jgi:probable HAF family extracellular repeat protein